MRHILLIVCFLLEARVSEAQLVFDRPPPGGETIERPETTANSILYSLQVTDPAGNTPTFNVANSTCVSAPNTKINFTINNLDQLVVPTVGLDAETCTLFILIFTVTAGGSTETSGPLTIKVTDVNDNPPKFNKRSYSGEVWKNDGNARIVNENDTITARDPDISNLAVTLSISGAQTTFEIDDSGLVTVSGTSGLAALDSPTILTILASDGERTSTASLTITVHDDPCSSGPCQNGATCISNRGNLNCSCLPGYEGQLCERVNYCFVNHCQHNGTCVNGDSGYECNCMGNYVSCNNCTRNLTVSDRRITVNENDTLSIDMTHLENGSKMYYPDCLDANITLLHETAENTAHLSMDFNGTHLMLRGIDREKLDSLTLNFSFQVEQAVVFCNLILNITDVNDNPPIFTKNASDTEVCSSVKEGTVLFNVSAVDADATEPHNVFNYSLLSVPDDLFTIDSKGVVKTRASINNATGLVNVTVYASDGQFNASSQCLIRVYNGNCTSCESHSDNNCTSIATTVSTTTTHITTKSDITTPSSSVTMSSTKTAFTEATTIPTVRSNTATIPPTSNAGTVRMIIGLSVAGGCAIIILVAMICLYVHYTRLAKKQISGQASVTVAKSKLKVDEELVHQMIHRPYGITPTDWINEHPCYAGQSVIDWLTEHKNISKRDATMITKQLKHEGYLRLVETHRQRAHTDLYFLGLEPRLLSRHSDYYEPRPAHHYGHHRSTTAF